MSLKLTHVFECDRCGRSETPRTNLRAEDDDGFPDSWARVTFRDRQVIWEKDLCGICANEVGQKIRTARFD
jgi:hypothetical protein